MNSPPPNTAFSCQFLTEESKTEVESMIDARMRTCELFPYVFNFKRVEEFDKFSAAVLDVILVLASAIYEQRIKFCKMLMMGIYHLDWIEFEPLIPSLRKDVCGFSVHWEHNTKWVFVGARARIVGCSHGAYHQ